MLLNNHNGVELSAEQCAKLLVNIFFPEDKLETDSGEKQDTRSKAEKYIKYAREVLTNNPATVDLV